jgi:hypothetical protein
MLHDIPAVRQRLRKFDFTSLFTQELGWDFPGPPLTVHVKEQSFALQPVAKKRGVQVLLYRAEPESPLPDYATRRAIHKAVRKSAHEHLLIFVDSAQSVQIWQWVAYRPGQPPAYREHIFRPASQSGEALIQKLSVIAVPISEEEAIDLTGALQKLRDAFDRERVTKRFYDRFKAEHAAFLEFIKGIKAQADLEWYTSLMLNRLMFVYFIQKKGFLDGDVNYLRNRLQMVQQARGKDKFQSFYRYFLVRLFHDGLGKHKADRKLDRELEKLLGKVPYLNGGFFEVHQLEERNTDIDIPDKAFEKLFNFFDEFSWHLDERPLREGNEINPDVVGYIFEKYINQKQMGAYYTKEDITEYISKNTIIPFLFDAAQKKCPAPFKPESPLWRLLREDPDRYIYAAVRHGVLDAEGQLIPLPKGIKAGIEDVSQRDGWNRPAPEPYSLPTETWREHVARRQRCLELREKLQRGEIYQINDLITLNLDIWQFARDAILNSESPDLLRAFWHAIAGRIPQKSTEKFEPGITVLDPTCGSGAFLFAALRILETLYSDCVERMETFVEDRAASKHQSEKFRDFQQILAQIADHPSERYFILKSIIINNLFGVDIMEEAVEICKLRLFLKLVAQVETADQIEPLPDIDFNIRAGNTLVGYVSLAEIRQARAAEQVGNAQQRLLVDSDADAEIRRIEEDALAIEKSFEQFRTQQTTQGGQVTAKDKQELRRRLAKLDGELDRYLAREYGIAPKTAKTFDQWKASHQPFHWFVEFFGIMANGGFDVIIGNPPYVEYKDVKTFYTVKNFQSEACGDLYGFCTERSLNLLAICGRIGLIVPISIFGTDGFKSLQQVALESTDLCWVSCYANRPSQLFDGAQKRLTILVGKRSSTSSSSVVFTSRYHRWKREEFPILFPGQLQYGRPNPMHSVFPASLEKVGSALEASTFAKLVGATGCIADAITDEGMNSVYYTRKFGYFLAFTDFVPTVMHIATGRTVAPSELKEIKFQSSTSKYIAIAALASSTFFWFWNVLSDCRNLNRRDLLAFPLNPDLASSLVQRELSALGKQYIKALRATSRTMLKSGLHIETFDYGDCKPVINEIDRVLAGYFKLAGEEHDFIVNYDVKYRMGQEESGADE